MSKKLSDKELSERELDFRIDRTQTEYLKEVLAQRTWVGLTDDEMWNAYAGGSDIINLDYAKAIEAKLKEKNT